MAKCSVCGKDVGTSYKLFEGKKYCDECYRAFVPQEDPIISGKNSTTEAKKNQSETAEPPVPVIAQVFAVFAVLEWIFGTVGVIKLGIAYNEVTLIGSLLIVFIVGGISMGFSTIINLLAEIAWNTKQKE